MTGQDVSNFVDKIKGYFDISSYLIPQAEAEQVIRDGVAFRGINILILIIAIFIASLGLNVNSTAVIIGAMLISPLMGPIIGIGLAVGIHDFDLMKRSFRNLMMATLFSVVTSCVYFMVSPVNEGHSELLARTSPTIYDVFIGFFGGAAGILAIGSKVKGNVIPGVAIATALMPPLCTVGYGLATLQWTYFLGAMYLFFINSVFIACATTVGVWLMKYTHKDFSNPERARKVRNTVYAIAVVTMLPAVYLTYTMYVQNTFDNNCNNFVDTEFNFPDTQVLSFKPNYNKGDKTLTVTLMGRVLPQDSLVVAMSDKMAAYRLGGTKLKIIQGDAYGPQIDVSQATSTMLRDMYAVTQATIRSQERTIDSLKSVYSFALRDDSLSAVIAPELKILFPSVEGISISRCIYCEVDAEKVDTLNVALVGYRRQMPKKEEEKFRDYLQARLHMADVHIVKMTDTWK